MLQEIEGRPGHFLSLCGIRHLVTIVALNIADGYWGYCFTLVTRVPVKRTNTVFDGGWP